MVKIFALYCYRFSQPLYRGKESFPLYLTVFPLFPLIHGRYQPFFFSVVRSGPFARRLQAVGLRYQHDCVTDFAGKVAFSAKDRLLVLIELFMVVHRKICRLNVRCALEGNAITFKGNKHGK
ncbi:MAG: hypothetical protein ACAI35_26410 [Candidatus Methylacidiphilales bacterium]